MREALIATIPTIVVLLYAGVQLIAQSTLGRMYFSPTFVPELVVYVALAAIYVCCVRYFRGKRHFTASIAGAIIGVAFFVFAALWLFFNFEFARDLSI